MIKLLLIASMASSSWMSFLWNSNKHSIDKKEEQENASIILEEEDTPVEFNQPPIQIEQSTSRPWVAPDYGLSKDSIGYDTGFKVTDGLQVAYEFWLSMYTKYSSWQGVLHDSEHIDHIYVEIDFTPIMLDEKLNDTQKRKAKRNLVRNKKKEVIARLRKLQNIKSADDLSGEDLRLWNMYSNVNEANKFIKASKKGRLRFQLGQKDYFLQGIYNSGRYIQFMQEVFKKENLPIELTRLPFVESSFNLRARSKVGASGIWQFMRSTGKQYMKVNGLVDYRNDPIQSTKSAARKLKSNFKLTGAWPLAITGYNYGPSGIARLSKKLGTKDLVEIIKNENSRRFGFASRNFYPSFLAAVEAERHADKYFTSPKWMPALDFEEYKLPRNMRFSSIQGIFQDYGGHDVMLYNPQLTRYTVRNNAVLYRGYKFYLPKSNASELKASLDKLAAPSIRAKGGSQAVYKVQKGDTLSSIAKLFGVRLRDLLEWNNLRTTRIYAGQKLSIPQ